MAGIKIVPVSGPEAVGVILIQQGWCQGSLLEAASASRSWLTLRDHQDGQGSPSASASQDIWILRQALLDAEDVLIVASQTCDIQRSAAQEPYIEVIRGFWTSDRAIMHQAGKNSSRLFLMQRRSESDVREQALIADATTHLQIEKAALLAFTSQSSFKENDRITPRKFSEWLARRYNRPALPDAIVNAIQKPVVRGIDKLSASDRLHRILDGIDEILFIPANESVPFLVDMIFIRDERSDSSHVSDEDAARLGNWIAELLLKGKEAELSHWEILGRNEISVYDYSTAYELPLDYYTSWEDSAES
jgi:hypothetical protein